MSNIDGNLWQGATPAYMGGPPEWLRFIVSAYDGEGGYKRYPHQVYTYARMYDAADVPDPELLYALADYVNAVRKIGPTLVHCQMGLNRSGLIVALALIRSGWKPESAIERIKQQRPGALFNMSFCDWLMTQRAA